MAKADEKPEIRVRRAAMNLLARREQSFYELTQKLTQKYPDLDQQDIILPALERLRAENQQSDDRFLEAYVRYRSSRGVGPLRIDMELNQKGLSGSQVQAAIHDELYDWVAICRDAAEKRFSQDPPASMEDKQKRYRFLQQRGFEPEQIKKVLG